MAENIRILNPSDVPQALALSQAVGWNQTPADWSLVIEMSPAGCFALECDGQLVATTSTIRYGTELAWVGMVLTHPEFRGRGYARTLMEHALDHLHDVRTVKLDATEMGRPLYKPLGFVEECATERWIRPAQPCQAEFFDWQAEPPAPPQYIKPLQTGGTGAFACRTTFSAATEPRPQGAEPLLDKQAFGADRGALLNRLAQFEAASFDDGFAMGRADRFGPCVSRSRETALKLAQWFLARHPNEELLWDLFPENNLAESFGFQLSRRLTRMTHGRTLTGDNTLIYAGAGFEFG